MSRLGPLALAAAVLLALAAGAGAEPTVIVISMDGVRHDYLDRASLPALERMAREGWRAERLRPVYPSSTFPGHVSLATGTTPDVHGIVDNRFWDRERGEEFDYSNDAGWIQAEPLWAAAERQGVPTATFFWVGSETDWRGVGARYRRAPFDSGIGEAEKVRQLLAWLDLPPGERPRLLLSWWHGTDSVGHRKGPDHPDVAEALREQDRHLGALLAGLDARGRWSGTTLLVVSDHGMTVATATLPVRERLAAGGVEARLVLGSAVSHLFSDDADELRRAEQALARLEGLRVDRRDALPSSLGLAHPTRTGDLVLRAIAPHTFRPVSTVTRAAKAALGWKRGLHGYPPEHPDMAGILLALGRGAAPAAPPRPVRMIDVAATVARLLGIEPPRHSRGEPIPELAPPAPGPDAPGGGA